MERVLFGSLGFILVWINPLIQKFGFGDPYQMVGTIPPRMLYTLVVHFDTSLIIVWIAKPITSYHGGFYFWYSPQRLCLFHSPHHRWGINHISHLGYRLNFQRKSTAQASNSRRRNLRDVSSACGNLQQPQQAQRQRAKGRRQ